MTDSITKAATTVSDLIKQHGPGIVLYAVVLLGMGFLVHFYLNSLNKEVEANRKLLMNRLEARDQQLVEETKYSREVLTTVVKENQQVVQDNTKAFIQQSEALDDLTDAIRDLRNHP